MRYSAASDNWLGPCLESVRCVGYAIVEGVLSREFIAATRQDYILTVNLPQNHPAVRKLVEQESGF